jgi:hypothetical protein
MSGFHIGDFVEWDGGIGYIEEIKPKTAKIRIETDYWPDDGFGTHKTILEYKRIRLCKLSHLQHSENEQ